MKWSFPTCDFSPDSGYLLLSWRCRCQVFMWWFSTRNGALIEKKEDSGSGSKLRGSNPLIFIYLNNENYVNPKSVQFSQRGNLQQNTFSKGKVGGNFSIPLSHPLGFITIINKKIIIRTPNYFGKTSYFIPSNGRKSKSFFDGIKTLTNLPSHFSAAHPTKVRPPNFLKVSISAKMLGILLPPFSSFAHKQSAVFSEHSVSCSWHWESRARVRLW